MVGPDSAGFQARVLGEISEHGGGQGSGDEVALGSVGKAMQSGDYDLIVLDEVNMVVSWGWLKAAEVMKIIEEKPSGVELILTGRNADPRFLEAADLVTEMVKIKHPFDQGILARKGIEY